MIEQVYLLEGRTKRPFSQAANVRARGYSLKLQRAITDLGVDMSYEQVIAKMKEHYGITLPASSTQRVVKEHAEEFKSFMIPIHQKKKAGHSKILIAEIDGSMVPIVSTDPEAPDKRKNRTLSWKEARLSVVRQDGCVQKFFGATLGSTKMAGKQCFQCALAAGLNKETRVHAVGDGAPWICEEIDRVFGMQAKYLIDFYHLSEYLAAAAFSCEPNSAKKWLSEQQGRMKKNGIQSVLKELNKWLEPEGVENQLAPVRRCHRYINNRLKQFDYAGAIMRDLPIGSGEVESSHRSIIQKRLKIPGAWWKEEMAESMLAIRCGRANNQWEKYWMRYEAFREAA